MQKTFVGCLVSLLGVVAGGFVGGCLGLTAAYVSDRIGHHSCFEGACAYGALFVYLPIGVILGAAAGGLVPLVLARRRRELAAETQAASVPPEN